MLEIDDWEAWNDSGTICSLQLLYCKLHSMLEIDGREAWNDSDTISSLQFVHCKHSKVKLEIVERKSAFHAISKSALQDWGSINQYHCSHSSPVRKKQTDLDRDHNSRILQRSIRIGDLHKRALVPKHRRLVPHSRPATAVH
jgi:hypothetical protein